MKKSFKEFLKESENDRERYLVLRNLRGWTQPADWKEPREVSEEQLERQGVQVGMIPFYREMNVYGDRKRPRPFDYFDITPKEDIFLLDMGEQGLFLVKREGYDYARYVIRVTQ